MENLFREQETQDLFDRYVYLLKKEGANQTKLEAIEQDRFYSFLINHLTCLDVSEPEAKQHYYRILEHKTKISQKLGRDVGLPVATLDYFQNIEGNMKNPKAIENELFEQLLNQSKVDPKTKSYHLAFFKEMSKPGHTEEFFFGYPSQIAGLQGFHADNIYNSLVIHDDHIRIRVSISDLYYLASYQKNNHTVQVMHDWTLFGSEYRDQRNHDNTYDK